MHNRFFVLAIVAMAVAAGSTRQGSAHDLQVKVKLPPNEVVVEAGFDDDTPAEGARVTITTAGGIVVATGKTDDRGVCTLAKLGAGKYVAVVESHGHRDAVEFEVAEHFEAIEFSNWRLDKKLGVSIGVLGLLVGSIAFWWLRLRKPG